MKYRSRLLVWLSVVAVSLTSAATVSAQESEEPQPTDGIVELAQGSRAPFAGMLYPEETAARWRQRIVVLTERLRLDVEACERIATIRSEGLQRELTVEREHAATDVSRLREALRTVESELNAARHKEWYEQEVFWLSTGLVLGAAGVIAAVVAAGG